ncbi:SUKH-4 family immunity protein [Streptomyces sp. 2A115]|uniref:SUKH-4 family immunity protein n=1 Tax=Streptomyces sp. 2A115 TaxID=3457439 RepID=UPI003FD639A0
MSTVGSGAAVVTSVDGELGPYARHTGTWPWWAGPGQSVVGGAAEASARLLALVQGGGGEGGGVRGDVPVYWRMAAMVQQLARVGGSSGGLLLDLPGRVLDEAFGAGRVMRFEDVDFPAVLTHEPTRRFLRETGLPEDGFMFQLATDVPLPTLAEHYAAERGEEIPELPDGADRLIRLGPFAEDTDLLVDGSTGVIHTWSAPDATLRPLDADISMLGFTLWLLHREGARRQRGSAAPVPRGR